MSNSSNKASGNTSMIKSPCVLNCCLNKDDVCLGCYRHIKEIMDWKSLSNDGKQQVLETCATRKKEIKTVIESHVHPARTS
jgi:predicted Fe-S protein YdhL (DUF1289 family)